MILHRHFPQKTILGDGNNAQGGDESINFYNRKRTYCGRYTFAKSVGDP
jgi:hypothetical protein